MGGLYLEVLPSGKRTFRMQYRIGGKQLTLTLGEYPAMGLQAARGAAVDARMLVKAGRDPKGPAPAPDGADTFRQVADEWFRAQAGGWKPSHATRVWGRVQRYLLPDLGARSVRQVTARELLDVLRKIGTDEKPKADTVKRVREYASQIWTFAVASDKADTNPATGLSKALPRAPRQQHRAALSVDQLPAFFAKLSGSRMEPATALCIRLLAHTAVRPGELIHGLWSEVQGDRWIIPAERMKMQRDHIVPLSPQAQSILKELRAMNPKSARLAPHLGPDTMGQALNKLMGKGVVHPHGWRTTFSTAANDAGIWSADAIERQLAHVEGNKVRAAYNRALHIEERTRLMAWWSDQLDAAEAEGLKKSSGDLTGLLG